jgi:hypothetical protein
MPDSLGRREIATMASESRSLKRLIRAFGLALIASFALTGIAAGSASAATQHWYRCQSFKYENGDYKDPACSEAAGQGTGAYGLIKLNEGTATSFAMTGTTGFTLKWKLGGSDNEITCATQTSTESTVKNPVGGAAGTAFMRFELSNCTVVKPTGCTVSQPFGAILNGEATEFGGKPAVKFTAYESVNLFEIHFEGACSWSGLSFNVRGSFTGIMGKNGSLEFTEASSSMTIGGNSAKLLGTSKVQTALGESLVLAP